MDAETVEQYTRGGRCSVAEAAKLLHTSRWSVHAMIRRGELIAWTASENSRKLHLYKRQVLDITSRQQERAIREADALRRQMVFDL